MRIGQRVSFGPNLGTVVRLTDTPKWVAVKWDSSEPWMDPQWMLTIHLRTQPEITEYPAHLLIHEADGSCRVAS